MTWPIQAPHISCAKYIKRLFSCLMVPKGQSISEVLRDVGNILSFYGEGLLVPHLTSNLVEHPLSSACDRLFSTFPAALHQEGRSSTLNLRTSHVLVTGTHLSRLLVHA